MKILTPHQQRVQRGSVSIFLTILGLLPEVLGLIRSIMSYVEAAKQRGIGRLEATSEALTIQMEELRLAQEARFTAHAQHEADPTDDAFDREFERKDP